ncbi:MAG: SDR family oxidoreductase [Nitrososphaerota archaeon]|jgi:NAD(P)-dependent dehydrogenase (short-subunit alcohol dehydrogenase family)|nr:SDR family oxidoreductase [Nitrososphaerota archaeon]MDG6930258.1 SDR family oxidoreductase [Nitrososphaerota archaeon]MDG6932618.1 SDR family oxidoreductase [Nitrososphaerota archaeon]MDG6935590.1 SDR family oxidoreductase [Nitrososphaerota archaeon]MDG6944034.1 SDR family oxidoreductase [Nitrososphaerota archaeon]
MQKVAIITGAARGIGLATRKIFSERGYTAVGMDIIGSPDYRCDVSNENDVIRAVNHVREKYGRIDVLVNVAGIVLVKPVEEIEWSEFVRVMSVNLGGTFLMIKHVVPVMKAQNGGAIINMASVSGHVGQIRHSIYGASKGGIISLTKSLAWELAPYKIRVNSISPGSVDTQMLRDDVAGEADRMGVKFEEVRKMREAEQAFQRWADPAEIAEAVYFLASDGASFITGTDLLVDCGWTAK